MGAGLFCSPLEVHLKLLHARLLRRIGLGWLDGGFRLCLALMNHPSPRRFVVVLGQQDGGPVVLE